MDEAVFLFWSLSSCFLHRTRCPPESVPSCEISSCSSCTTVSAAASLHALLRFICVPPPPPQQLRHYPKTLQAVAFPSLVLDFPSFSAPHTRLFPLSSSDLFNAHVRSDAFGAEFQMIHTALGSCALTSFTWGVSDSGWSSRLFG